jgi:uncharacterized protein YkwD
MQKSLILLPCLAPVLLGCISPETVAAIAPVANSAPVISVHYVGQGHKRSNSALKASMMTRHNAARRNVGAPALIWDDALVRSAQKYANTLSASGRFEHDPANSGYDAEGENLWMGTRGAFSYDEMVNAWIDERQYFKNGPFPENSRTGNWGDVGHYTQIIWPTTTKIGCALATNSGNDVLVCRYSPGGNIVGRDPLKG